MRTIDVVAARDDEGQVGYEFSTCLGRSVWVGGLEEREKREKAALETQRVYVHADTKEYQIHPSIQSLLPPLPLPLPYLPRAPDPQTWAAGPLLPLRTPHPSRHAQTA